MQKAVLSHPANQTNPTIEDLKTTARLMALLWVCQLRDAGDPVPNLRQLTAQILREFRANRKA